MAVEDRLQKFAAVEGFAGVGIFNPGRESLAVLADDQEKLRHVGVLANDVMGSAEKASLDMGTGMARMVHIEAEQAHILVRCRNENPDPPKHLPGKAHVHVIVLLSPQANVGLAMARTAAIMDELEEEFWTWCRIKQYGHERW